MPSHRSQFLALILPLLISVLPTGAAAQGADNIVSTLLGGLARTAAIMQSTQSEWSKLPRAEVACVGRVLQKRGGTFASLIENGVKPNDPRISDIRAACVPTSVPAAISASQYAVAGLALGEQVQLGSDEYRSYDCKDSEQFSGLTWCQKRQNESVKRGNSTLRFLSSYSILHSQAGEALYINRYLEPAWFTGNEASEDINRLSKKYGPPARVIPIPQLDGLNGMIVTWGDVTLEQLDPANTSELADGHDVHVGLMIDHIGNYQRSAKLGLPIYRLTGGAGYVWAASWNNAGVGTLRFLTIDAAKIAQLASPRSPDPTLDKSPAASSTSDGVTTLKPADDSSSDKTNIEALIAENKRLEEAKKVAEAEAQHQKDNAAEAELRATLLEKAHQAMQDSRAQKEKEAAENEKKYSWLLYMISAGVLLAMILIVAFYRRRWKQADGKINAQASSQDKNVSSEATDSQSRRSLQPPSSPKEDREVVSLPQLEKALFHGSVDGSNSSYQVLDKKKRPGPIVPLLGSLNFLRPLSGLLNGVLVFSLFPVLLAIGSMLVSKHSLPDMNFLNFSSSPKFKVEYGRDTVERRTDCGAQDVFDNGFGQTFSTGASYRCPMERVPGPPRLMIQSQEEEPILIKNVIVNDDQKCTDNSETQKAAIEQRNKETNGQVDKNFMMLMGMTRIAPTTTLKYGEVWNMPLLGCKPLKATIFTDRGEVTYHFE